MIDYKEAQQMGWKGAGNPQPRHTTDSNGPGLAIAKFLFSWKKIRQTKAVKPK